MRQHTQAPDRSRLPGWFSPAASNTVNTADLVAEAGITYYRDWYHDNQPTPFKTKTGRLVSVPYTMDINDFYITRTAVEGEEFADMAIDQFDQLVRDAKDGAGRVMCVALHLSSSGQPHRIQHLDRLLKHILVSDAVWPATGLQIAGATSTTISTPPKPTSPRKRRAASRMPCGKEDGHDQTSRDFSRCHPGARPRGPWSSTLRPVECAGGMGPG